MASYYVYVGAITGQGKAEGISVFRLDGDDGALVHVQTVGDLQNPSFLALHPKRPFLYAVTRSSIGGGQQQGNVVAFAIDEGTGALRRLNQEPSGGVSPAYVHVEQEGRYVLAANYGSGHVAALPIGEDGTVGPATSVVQQEGRGPVVRRQEGPHAHMITTDPSGTFALACDLGADRVTVYRLDREKGQLVLADLPYAQLNSGAGPRHLSFHPSGRFAYVIDELDSTMTAFAFDVERGTMTAIHTASTLPDGWTGTNHPSQIVVHPSGRFVYGSNRGHDSIVIFAIDQETGKLRLVGHESTQGKVPRNFNVDPTGALLLAANQDTNTIVAFRIDQQSGKLTATGAITPTPAPVCIQFRPVG